MGGTGEYIGRTPAAIFFYDSLYIVVHLYGDSFCYLDRAVFIVGDVDYRMLGVFWYIIYVLVHVVFCVGTFLLWYGSRCCCRSVFTCRDRDRDGTPAAVVHRCDTYFCW